VLPFCCNSGSEMLGLTWNDQGTNGTVCIVVLGIYWSIMPRVTPVQFVIVIRIFNAPKNLRFVGPCAHITGDQLVVRMKAWRGWRMRVCLVHTATRRTWEQQTSSLQSFQTEHWVHYFIGSKITYDNDHHENKTPFSSQHEQSEGEFWNGSYLLNSSQL
jgi:hypothetical protein